MSEITKLLNMKYPGLQGRKERSISLYQLPEDPTKEEFILYTLYPTCSFMFKLKDKFY